MSQGTTIEIPYRLETCDDVREAMRVNLLGIGDGYRAMLRVAEQTRLPIPPALEKARGEVRKEFYKVKEETVRQTHIRYEELATLSLVRDFHRIEQSLPWACEIAQHENFSSLLYGLSEGVRTLCRVDPPPRSPMAVYESAVAIRRMVKQELLSHVRSRRTKGLTLDELKRLLVAYCLFTSTNEDVLQALRSSHGRGAGDPLYQNALAELLFDRLPAIVAQFVARDPKAIREKLFSKLGKLDMTVRQRVNLYGYFKPNTSPADLVTILETIETVAQRMHLSAETRQTLHAYLLSLKHSLDRASELYREFFLVGGDLEPLRKLHVPGKVLKSHVTYTDTILRTSTKVAELRFYPTKDYLDLCRGLISGDCIDSGLSEAQLATPNFFNVRVFSETQWIGNIYMLDFTAEQGVLLIDRIQIPRQIRVPYLQFFETLVETLREMFRDVTYECILAPLTISNHATLQRAFNTYRKNLPKRQIRPPSAHGRYFECLRENATYHALCRKESP
jgi:hypothetical protein